MATKKNTKAKAGKSLPKKTVKQVKKAAPAKKSAKPPVKSANKPAIKPKSKPVAKSAHKTVAKAKPVAKPKSKAPAAKVAVKKPIAGKKLTPVKHPMTKKIAVKHPVSKPVPVKPPVVTKKPEAVKTPGKVKVQLPVKAVHVVKNPEPVKAKDIRIIPAKPVVLPKINTKTSRRYQPDFTKSVLDQPAHDLGAPIVRYSDTDLAEFKDLIQRKLESAKKELSYLQGLITRKDEMGGDNDDARYMTMEDGSMSMEREQLSQMASRQITFIDHLEKALMRIENKTYGICRVTGRLIDKARLRAVPHATLSIEAKMGAVK